MMIDSMPLWQLTVGEFRKLLVESRGISFPSVSPAGRDKKYVYGISGIAELFQCSVATANKIKASGRIDKAIIQVGRKIIVDADLALELAGKKK